MFKKTLLAVACCSLTSIAFADNLDGRSAGVSGAGLASDNFADGIGLNPASSARMPSGRGYSLQLGVSAFASDENELLDNASDLVDLFDDYEVSGVISDSAVRNRAASYLSEMAGNSAQINASAGFQLNLPNRFVAAALFANAELGVGLTSDVRQSDITLLQGADPVDTDQLQSSLYARGALVTDFGLNLARQYDNTVYGVNIKQQEVKTIDYSASVNDYDDDDFDADAYTLEDSNINLDLGVQHIIGNYSLGATVHNAIKQDYKTVSGRTVSIEPRLSLGAAYRNDWFSGSFDIDANKTENLATGGESQFARVGIQLNAWSWAQLRLGYRTDLKDQIEDTASVGLGFSPFGVIMLDVSAFAGSNNTIGAAIRLGAAW